MLNFPMMKLIKSNHENCSTNAKLIDHNMPNFKDILWTINEIMNEQSNDPFCQEIIKCLRKIDK